MIGAHFSISAGVHAATTARHCSSSSGIGAASARAASARRRCADQEACSRTSRAIAASPMRIGADTSMRPSGRLHPEIGAFLARTAHHRHLHAVHAYDRTLGRTALSACASYRHQHPLACRNNAPKRDSPSKTNGRRAPPRRCDIEERGDRAQAYRRMPERATETGGDARRPSSKKRTTQGAILRTAASNSSGRPNQAARRQSSCPGLPNASPMRSPHEALREMPTEMPSVFASRFAAANASSFPRTAITSSYTCSSSTSGTNPAPIPWILHALFCPQKARGNPQAPRQRCGFRILPLQISARTRDRAAGSTPATKISTAPSVSSPVFRTRRGGMNGGIGGVRTARE